MLHRHDAEHMKTWEPKVHCDYIDAVLIASCWGSRRCSAWSGSPLQFRKWYYA
jgi:hypothetical protein